MVQPPGSEETGRHEVADLASRREAPTRPRPLPLRGAGAAAVRAPGASELARLAGGPAAAADLERAVAQSLAANPEAAQRQAVYLAAAQLNLTGSAPDLDRAIEHLQAAHAIDPDDDDALWLLDRTLERARRTGERARALEEAAEPAPALRRAARLATAATIYEDAGDPAGAERCRLRILEVPGEDARAARGRALERLADRLRTAADWEKLTALLARHAADLGPAARARALAELIEIQDTRLRDGAAAWLACKQLFTLRADDDAALAFARRHLQETGETRELARILAAAGAAAQLPERALALWRDAARAAETDQADVDLARRAWRRAWQLEPSCAEARAGLKRLLALAGDWRGYRDLLEREARQVARVEEKVEVYRELAAFQRQVLRDDRAAEAVYGLLLQLVPADAEALAARVELAEAQADLTALAGALDRQLRTLPTATARASVRRKLAETLERLGESKRATEQLLVALREAEEEARIEGVTEPRRPAEWALARAQRAQDWTTVARLCEAAGDVEGAQSAKQRAAAQIAARRRSLTPPPGEDEAKGAHSVASLLEAAQAAVPAQAAALRLRAAHILLHLEPPRLAAAAEAAMGALEHEAVVEDALELLEPILAAEGSWDALAAAYERAIAKVARTDAVRARLYGRLAQVHSARRADPRAAARALESQLAIDPLDRAARSELARQQDALARAGDRARWLEECIADHSGAERAVLLGELLKVVVGDPAQLPRALEIARELLEIEPKHQEALTFCRADAERAGDWQAVFELVRRLAEATRSPMERAARYVELAELARDRLADPNLAAQSWRRAWELAPGDAMVEESLRRQYASIGQLRELAHVLAAGAARAPTVEAKLARLSELASLQEDRLGDRAAALETWRTIAQLTPNDPAVLERLAAIYAREGRPRDRLLALRARLSHTKPQADRIALLRQIAKLHAGALGSPDDAAKVYGELLAEAPGDPEATAALRELHQTRGDWRALADLLEATLAAPRETHRNGQAEPAGGPLAGDPAREVALRIELGQLLANRLDEPARGAAELERALALDRANEEVLTTLGLLYEDLEAWDKLIELHRRRAAAGRCSLAEALVAIGRIYDARLAEPTRAREAFEQAVHLDPARRDALAALRSLAERREDWMAAVSLGRREERMVTEPHERAAVLAAVARVLADKLGRPARAIEVLEEALHADPAHLLAAERLADLHFAAGEPTRAAALYEQIVTRGGARDRLHDVYLRLGVAAERSGDADRAFAYYIQSFNHDSLHEPTLTRLSELCFQRGQWENTVRVSEAVASACHERLGENPKRAGEGGASATGPGAPTLVIQTAEELAELYFRLGVAHLHIGQKQVALELLASAGAQGDARRVLPDSAWRDAAEAWAAQRFERKLLAGIPAPARRKAEVALARCLRLRPRHALAMQTVAAAAVAWERWDDALAHLERCADLVEIDRERRIQLLQLAGEICAKKKLDRPRADRLLRRASALQPGGRPA
jgi:tetratricopeptide (TPR) repeat protein